jgi:hypothetical protein
MGEGKTIKQRHHPRRQPLGHRSHEQPQAKYPLELFLRVIKVSLETMKCVDSLPKL